MTSVTRSLNTRAVRRLEKPRPLNRPTEGVESFTPSIETNISEGVMTLLDFVSSTISKENFDDVLAVNIGMLCKQLELYGAQLEATNKAQLDQAFYLFRDASRNNRLDHVARLNLLKLIELRDSHWQPGNNFTSFYTASFSPGSLENAVNELTLNSKSVPYPPLSPVLSPGEMIKASGKFPKPTKLPGKNYCKDEVVIRNADSGKVMGIKGRRVHMIEELSETIISFQRVPSGAKERLVQITGPSEDNISHAIHLMDDTIRRNASPIREPVEKDQMGGSSSSLNSSASDESNRIANHISEKRLHSNSTNESSFDEFKYTVTVGNEVIRIVSSNFGLAMTAKLVLDEHFANASNPIESSDYFSPCKSNSSMYSVGVNEVVPSISKKLSMDNDSLKSSGISLGSTSSLNPSFSSLSSTPSGIAYSNLSGSVLSSDLQSPPIAQPFSSYVANNLISDSNQIGNQSILSSNSSILSPVISADSANNVILSSPGDLVTPISLAELNDGRNKAFSLNQSLSALLSVTSTKKDEPRIKQYSKDALEALRSSNISSEPPQNWERIAEEFPSIVKTRGTVSLPTTPTAGNFSPSGLFACSSVPTTPPAYNTAGAPTGPVALPVTRPAVTTTDPPQPRPPRTVSPASASPLVPHPARAAPEVISGVVTAGVSPTISTYVSTDIVSTASYRTRESALPPAMSTTVTNESTDSVLTASNRTRESPVTPSIRAAASRGPTDGVTTSSDRTRESAVPPAMSTTATNESTDSALTTSNRTRESAVTPANTTSAVKGANPSVITEFDRTRESSATLTSPKKVSTDDVSTRTRESAITPAISTSAVKLSTAGVSTAPARSLESAQAPILGGIAPSKPVTLSVSPELGSASNPPTSTMANVSNLPVTHSSSVTSTTNPSVTQLVPRGSSSESRPMAPAPESGDPRVPSTTVSGTVTSSNPTAASSVSLVTRARDVTSTVAGAKDPGAERKSETDSVTAAPTGVKGNPSGDTEKIISGSKTPK
nr:PREDICTED: mucin-19-like isoform X1 [Bemisia tabaci]